MPSQPPAPAAIRDNGRVIVDCAVYRDGSRVPLAGEPNDMRVALEAAREKHSFVWIGLHEPDQTEMDEVAQTFGLHSLAIEDAIRAHQRPKLERYDEVLFMVLKTMWYVDEQDAVETGEIAIFVGPHYVVTVRHGAGSGLTLTRRDLEDRVEVLGHGPYAVLHSVCDHVVDEYESVAEELQVDVDEIEQSVFSDQRGKNDSQRIYTLKREMAEFRRAVVPLREPLSKFANGQVAGMPADAQAFFRDVADHATRVHEQVESLDGLLSSAHNAHVASISMQQNNDMRKISAWVAIAAVPTAVAGIYGMNFDYMPELHWQYGYPLVLVVMLGVCVTLYRLFKKSAWL